MKLGPLAMTVTPAARCWASQEARRSWISSVSSAITIGSELAVTMAPLSSMAARKLAQAATKTPAKKVAAKKATVSAGNGKAPARARKAATAR